MTQRVSIVIGGASGIGLATVRRLHADGETVVIADRNAEGAKEYAAELGVEALPVEVTDEASVSALITTVSERHGGIDTVVDCAGISRPGALTDLSAEDWRATVDVCLTGSFLVVKHAAPALRPGGSIVLIASLNATQPGVAMGAYCAAKAGVAMLTEVAALELGPRGIRVNAISPGFVPTPLTEGAALVPGLVEDFVANTPLGRAGSPEDIAAAVAFVASPAAGWMTGSNIALDGGAHTQRYPDILKHIAALAEG
ncbi:SDR family NAD(P)-dependent oxidoreductase [Nocardia asteroides]|uniref:SDR family NAD(P)-dependent oxidoreductase n=1 Tax=Nocardia asteroides TaxID=1824 RepID=UPI001E367995|nr:SDR family oxidoreductase [Nocardia asteroides]UGT61563.1 SDR family oxidoreductase [Nocardia asteroides]